MSGFKVALEKIERAQRGESRGVPSGIGRIDRHFNGFAGSELIIIGARPSMGKTALALSMAHNAATFGVRSLVFSLEMPNDQLVQRMVARMTGLPYGQQMRAGGLKDQQFREIAQMSKELSRLPIHIDDTPGLSVQQIRTRARRHKRRYGLDMIVIDYLGLISPPRNIDLKVYQIEHITNALKNLAKELDIPVVCLHQLSRDVEKRDNKRPLLADLRDSGAIEQDADIVMFLYRDEYYLERDRPARKANDTEEKYADRVTKHEGLLAAARGKAELIVAKFRNGTTTTINLEFDGRRQVFADNVDDITPQPLISKE